MRAFQIVVLGGGGVGKSALSIQFVRGEFQDYYDPTIEDSYTKQVEIDKEVSKLSILDTAGQEEFGSSMRDQYINQGEGFLCVYSCTDLNSLKEIEAVHKQIVQAKDGEKVPIVLVGNKSDLAEARQVTEEQGRALAKKLKTSFVETSAMLNQNVDEAFFTLVRLMRGEDPEAKPDDAGGCCVLM